jgi:CRISPR-associated endonuclease/helicase Cas3
MPKIDEQTRQERLDRIQRLLLRHPLGLRESEIAQRMGLPRRTINDYLWSAELSTKVYKEGVLWFAEPAAAAITLRPLYLTPEQAVTLYLAARLLVKQHDKRNEAAETALLKLADALRSDTDVGREVYQAAAELAGRPTDTAYSQVFGTVVQGFVYKRVLRLVYRPLHGEPFECHFSPYLLEPSAVGYTTYAIGHSDPPGALRTRKLERIQEAELTRQTFDVPSDFPGLEILRSAWVIIFGEELVEVRLRFSRQAAERVQETRWHPSQTVEPAEDGGCLWTAQVADVTDMLPWVRGWGSAVTVLEPPELRRRLEREARTLATIYGVSGISETPAHFVLWGKADRETDEIHRLIYHMIDVGQVALTLWRTCLNESIRCRLADWMGLSTHEAGQLVAFRASLHDVGKASPAFQDHKHLREPLKSQIRTELEAAGLGFVNRSPGETHTRHEIISTWSLRSSLGEGLLHELCGLDTEMANWIAQAVGGHHGAWPRPDQFDANSLTDADKGGSEWTAARAELVKAMTQIFQPPKVQHFGEDSTRNNVMLTLLSAIVSVADWIGSNKEYFPLEEEYIPLRSYVRHAKLHAEHALDQVNWESPAEMTEFTFEDVFPFNPTDAQQEGIAALSDIPVPAFAIIEAPMGTGKTELAFALYAHWAQQACSSGLYVAMPTTATSNQMHDRTAQFLTKQLGEEIEPLLVHSQALLRELPDQGDPIEESEGDAAAAQSWFLPRKRSLLAPYGVGTVDQALMSILQTKHFFVRLLGLSHKVVIFDEVHAYDAYMSELFEQLLKWLRAVNTSVIILSATLPDKTRHKLVRAYAGATSAPPAQKYPRITFATGDGQVNAIALTPPPSKTLSFDWLPRNVDTVVAKLREILHGEGCAAVICNTVGRAQDVFEAIRTLPEEQKLCNDDDLILFHARFPMAWREEIEQKVLRKFGTGPEKGKPNADRPPSRAIVVATQVIEQSLDLDFDVMISDHAPIDLLLQRAGRLHRHSVNDPRRHPYCLWITEPVVKKEVPQFDRRDTYVYDEYVLFRSWFALKGQEPNVIRMPEDMTDLIERVYGDRGLAISDEIKSVLDKAKQDMDRDEFNERGKARKRRVVKPDDEELLWGENLDLEEDDPSVHETFQALTRSGRPGLRVVCLHRIDGRLHLEPEEGGLTYDPSDKPSPRLVPELARRSVTIRRRDVEEYLLNESPDAEIRTILKHWKRIAALRYHRVVIFEDGLCHLEGTNLILKLDKKSQLGLQIMKEAT